MFHSHMLICFPIGFWIFMLLQKGRILFTFIRWEIMACCDSFHQSVYHRSSEFTGKSHLKQEKVTQKKIHQDFTGEILLKLS